MRLSKCLKFGRRNFLNYWNNIMQRLYNWNEDKQKIRHLRSKIKIIKDETVVNKAREDLVKQNISISERSR
jgi:hypothetical protein